MMLPGPASHPGVTPWMRQDLAVALSGNTREVAKLLLSDL